MVRPAENIEVLQQAKRKREQAKRCRALLREISTENRAAQLLTDYATELEERADTLERLAGDGRRHGRSASDGREN